MYTYIKRHLNGKKYYDTNNPVAIVCHTDLGVYEGTFSWLNKIQASYNIYIRRHKDEIIEFVPLNKGAWHAGRKNQPNEISKALFGSKNPNKTSIGLCYENGGKTPQEPTQRQIELATAWIKDMKLDKLPILAHREIAIDKPKVVYAMRDGILAGLKNEHKCKELKEYSVVELAVALVKKLS